jgi:hypothetical protein
VALASGFFNLARAAYPTSTALGPASGFFRFGPGRPPHPGTWRGAVPRHRRQVEEAHTSAPCHALVAPSSAMSVGLSPLQT